MTSTDEFTEALIDAFMGRKPDRRIIGVYPSQRIAVLAVARVALERAAEVADKLAGEFGGQARVAAIEVAAGIRDLIPPKKETT